MDIETLQALADDRNFKKGELLLARMALVQWQTELVLGNWVVVPLKGEK